MNLWQGPHRVRGPSRVPHSGKLRLLLPLNLPSIALLHVCSKSLRTPGQVGRLLWPSSNNRQAV